MITLSRRTRRAMRAGSHAAVLRLNALSANPYKPRSKCWNCWLWAHFETMIAIHEMDGPNPVRL